MITPRLLVAVVLALAAWCPASAQTRPSAQTKPAPPIKLTLEQAGSRTGRDFVPAYEGKEVVVTGPSLHQADLDHRFLLRCAFRTNTFFGLLLRPEIPQLPDLTTPGDWVEAQGTISKRAGLPILLPHTVRRLRHALRPLPTR